TSFNGGSVGLLKKGTLDWPRALRGQDFEEERALVKEAALEAVKQAKTMTSVDDDVLTTLSGGIDQLEAKLRGHVDKVAVSDYVAAKQYLRHLEDAVKALKQPD